MRLRDCLGAAAVALAALQAAAAGDLAACDDSDSFDVEVAFLQKDLSLSLNRRQHPATVLQAAPEQHLADPVANATSAGAASSAAGGAGTLVIDAAAAAGARTTVVAAESDPDVDMHELAARTSPQPVTSEAVAVAVAAAAPAESTGTAATSAVPTALALQGQEEGTGRSQTGTDLRDWLLSKATSVEKVETQTSATKARTMAGRLAMALLSAGSSSGFNASEASSASGLDPGTTNLQAVISSSSSDIGVVVNILAIIVFILLLVAVYYVVSNWRDIRGGLANDQAKQSASQGFKREPSGQSSASGARSAFPPPASRPFGSSDPGRPGDAPPPPSKWSRQGPAAEGLLSRGSAVTASPLQSQGLGATPEAPKRAPQQVPPSPLSTAFVLQRAQANFSIKVSKLLELNAGGRGPIEVAGALNYPVMYVRLTPDARCRCLEVASVPDCSTIEARVYPMPDPWLPVTAALVPQVMNAKSEVYGSFERQGNNALVLRHKDRAVLNIETAGPPTGPLVNVRGEVGQLIASATLRGGAVNIEVGPGMDGVLIVACVATAILATPSLVVDVERHVRQLGKPSSATAPSGPGASLQALQSSASFQALQSGGSLGPPTTASL